MNAGKKEILCGNCRKRVSYQIFKRPAKAIINDLEIEYDEYYGVCDECNSELFIPGLDDQNEDKVEELYRKKRELITIPEINSILEKYNIEKRPLSKLLGFGELTITRYIDGQLPSKRYSNMLLDILNDEQKMKALVEENKEMVSPVAVNKVLCAIERCEEEKRIDNSAERIALYIVHSGKEITNLLLQKVLYYVKGISNLFEGSTLIPEPCEAWKFGPVFPTVYAKYKDFGKQEITSNLSYDYVNTLITEDERKIVDYVLDTFGIYNAWFLKDLTHLEEPWKATNNGGAMDDALIYNYFERMNEIYHLIEPEGVDLYIKDMKKRMYRSNLQMRDY